MDNDHDSLGHTSRNLDLPSIDALYSSRSKLSSRFHAPIENENNNDNYYPDDDDNNDNNRYGDDYGFIDNFEDNSHDEVDDDEMDGNEEDECNIDQQEEIFATPKIDDDELFKMESLNDFIDSEILIWVFKFQQIFKIPDKALEALIKFFHAVLVHFNEQQFNEFPTSLYKAKKWLNFLEPKMQLAVCTECHKLHNVKDVITYKKEGKVAIMNCLHEEYPNNPIPSRRNKCNNPLSIIKRNKDQTIAIPRMLYPKAKHSPTIKHVVSKTWF